MSPQGDRFCLVRIQQESKCALQIRSLATGKLMISMPLGLANENRSTHVRWTKDGASLAIWQPLGLTQAMFGVFNATTLELLRSSAHELPAGSCAQALSSSGRFVTLMLGAGSFSFRATMGEQQSVEVQSLMQCLPLWHPIEEGMVAVGERVQGGRPGRRLRVEDLVGQRTVCLGPTGESMFDLGAWDSTGGSQGGRVAVVRVETTVKHGKIEVLCASTGAVQLCVATDLSGWSRSAMSFSSRGLFAFKASEVVQVWNIDAGQQVSHIACQANIFASYAVAFSPDAAKLAVAQPSGMRLHMYDVDSGGCQELWAGSTLIPYSGRDGVTWSPTGTCILVCGCPINFCPDIPLRRSHRLAGH